MEGVRRMFGFLLDQHQLTVAEFITDRHRQIQKYVREVLGNHHLAVDLKHFFDVWHIAKGKQNTKSFCKLL